MKKKILASTLLALCGSPVMAQSAFEGFNGGVTVSSVGSTTELSGSGLTLNVGQQTIVPTIDIGYTYDVSKEFVVGVSATYDLVDTKAGSASVSTTSVTLKGKDHYSINLKPGYVIGNTMLYGLLGYNSLKASASTGAYSLNFNGYGVGAGVAVMIDKNLYVKAEVQQISYSSKTDTGVTYKPSASVGTIGIGYKF